MLVSGKFMLKVQIFLSTLKIKLEEVSIIILKMRLPFIIFSFTEMFHVVSDFHKTNCKK